MVRQEKKNYSEEFKERVLAAYHNSDESISMIAERYGIKRDTFASWVYRKRTTPSSSKERINFVSSGTDFMNNEALSPEAKDARIRDLERQLSNEKMRSDCLEKMIEIAERELKIDIRKKSGAKRSLR
jgi:transposase-like protein